MHYERKAESKIPHHDPIETGSRPGYLFCFAMRKRPTFKWKNLQSHWKKRLIWTGGSIESNLYDLSNKTPYPR